MYREVERLRRLAQGAKCTCKGQTDQPFDPPSCQMAKNGGNSNADLIAEPVRAARRGQRQALKRNRRSAAGRAGVTGTTGSARQITPKHSTQVAHGRRNKSGKTRHVWHDFRVKNDDGKMGKAIKIHSPEFTSNRPADDHIAIGRKAIKVAQNLRKNCVLTRTSLSDGNLPDPPPPASAGGLKHMRVTV